MWKHIDFDFSSGTEAWVTLVSSKTLGLDLGIIQNWDLIMPLQMSLQKQTRLKQSMNIKQQFDTHKKKKKKSKIQKHTKLRPLGKILVFRFSLRLQLDEVHCDKLLNDIQNKLKFTSFWPILRKISGMGRVFDHCLNETSEK